MSASARFLLLKAWAWACRKSRAIGELPSEASSVVMAVKRGVGMVHIARRDLEAVKGVGMWVQIGKMFLRFKLGFVAVDMHVWARWSIW